MANLLRGLSPRHELYWVTLCTPSCDPAMPGLAGPARVALDRRADGALAQLKDSAMHPLATLERLGAVVSGLPLEIARKRSLELRRLLRSALDELRPDVVQIETTAMGEYASLVRRWAPRTRVVLDEFEVRTVALERSPEGYSAREYAAWERFEKRSWASCDAVLAMSEEEARRIDETAGTGKARVVANGADAERFAFVDRSDAEPWRLLFVGNMSHPPNAVGLLRFFEDVWPRLPEEASIDVIGKHAGPELLRFAGERVRFRGFVDDVRPYLARVSAAVVPIVSGGGTRLKVVEAMASGTPLVATPLACEGLGVADGAHAWLADLTDFPDVIARAMGDVARCEAMARRARLLVEERLAWPAICAELEAVWAGS